MGGGYGATIGDNSFVMKGLNARGYGREKANSQLAIIEETGIVGFVFYCALLIIFFTKGIRCFLRMSGEEKVAMGLILGTLVGLLLESVAEGWWDAPGGQEFTSFWVLFGLAMGVMSLEKRKMRYGYSSMEAPPREVLSESPATS